MEGDSRISYSLERLPGDDKMDNSTASTSLIRIIPEELADDNATLLQSNGSNFTGDEAYASGSPSAVAYINLLGVTFATLSIVLNVFFLISKCILKEKPTAYSRFMTNLSVSDIMSALSFLLIQYWPKGPFAVIDLNPDFYLVPALPYLFRSLPWLFFTSYLLTLNCLTINQWVAVCRPLKYSSLSTKTKVTVALVVIWMVAALQVLVPTIVLVLLSCLENRQEAKQMLWSVSKLEMQVWMVFYGLSTVINIILNIIVHKKIKALKKKCKGPHASNAGKSNIKMKHEAFVTVSMILIACLVCRIPFPVFGIMGISFGQSLSVEFYYLGNAGVIFLLHLNCLIDPIIYISRTKEIKACTKNLTARFCAWLCCQVPDDRKRFSLVTSTTMAHEVISFRERLSIKQGKQDEDTISNL